MMSRGVQWEMEANGKGGGNVCVYVCMGVLEKEGRENAPLGVMPPGQPMIVHTSVMGLGTNDQTKPAKLPPEPV